MHFCVLIGGQLGCLVVNWCFSVLLASLRVVLGQNFLLHPDRSLVSVRDLFHSVLEIRCVSVESEAGFWFVDPSLSDLVFLRLGSLNRSFYGYNFQFIRVVLPFLCFSALFRPFWVRVKRTVRCVSGGRSATGGQSGQERADGPLLFICDADRSWRTVYSEAFLSVPDAF